MQLEISGQHITITKPLRAHVEQKLARLARHAHDSLQHVHCILKLDNSRMVAEATVKLGRTSIYAEAGHSSDMYAAIDELTAKLDRQIGRRKEKLTGHNRGRTDGHDHG